MFGTTPPEPRPRDIGEELHYERQRRWARVSALCRQAAIAARDYQDRERVRRLLASAGRELDRIGELDVIDVISADDDGEVAS